MPLPLIPALESRRDPVASAVASWPRVKAMNSPSAARCPAIMMPMPASPAPAAIAADAKHERKNGDAGRLLLALAAPDRIAGDDVAELVGDDALDLVHIVRGLDQAGLKIDGLTLRNEGVDLGIVEKNDLDAVGVKPAATMSGSDMSWNKRSVSVSRRTCGPELSSCAAPGCQPAAARISASISRRAKRETGDLIGGRLPLLAPEPAMKTCLRQLPKVRCHQPRRGSPAARPPCRCSPQDG